VGGSVVASSAELEAEAPVESKSRTTASLLPDLVLRPQEAMVLEVLRSDASLQIDEILDLLETQLTSSEVFTALSSWKLRGACDACRGRITCETM